MRRHHSESDEAEARAIAKSSLERRPICGVAMTARLLKLCRAEGRGQQHKRIASYTEANRGAAHRKKAQRHQRLAPRPLSSVALPGGS